MSRGNVATDKPAVIREFVYPSGARDGVAYVPRGSGSVERVDSILLPGQLSDDVQEQYRRRGINAASLRMHRQVRWQDHELLVTWTVAGDEQPTPREHLAIVRRWYYREGHLLLPPGGVVIKPERGDKNGRVHTHGTVCRTFFPYMPVIESYSAAMEAEGYHSPTGYHAFVAGDGKGAHREGFGSSLGSARYMSSYMAKDWDDPCWVKGARKWDSVGCERPHADVYTGFCLSEIPDVLFDAYGCCSNGSGARISPFTDEQGELWGYRYHDGR